MKAPLRLATGMPRRERFRICEVPDSVHFFFHIVVLLMPLRPVRLLSSMLHHCCAVMATSWGTETGRASHTDAPLTSSFLNGFAITWTISQDTHIVRSRSCC